jgi:ribokinase
MIVVFGSINLDLIFPLADLPLPGQTVLTQTALVQPGGKGANQAVAAASDGARVVLAGAVGADALAAAAMAGLTGIDTSRVARLPGVATGCACVLVDGQGRNVIAVGAGANLHADPATLEDPLLGPGTTLLLQMECARAATQALIRRAHLARARIILNLAPYGDLAEASLRAVDVLVVNEAEAAGLAARFGLAAEAGALHAAFGPAVIRTRGAEGADLATAEGVTHIPPHAVRAIDTTAAGDCFVGVLAAALDRGLSLDAGCRRAAVAAALACTRPGSQASLPTAAEIEGASAINDDVVGS